jgi:hypothetical protein
MGKNIKPFQGTPITKTQRRGGNGKPLQTFHQQKHKRKKKIKNHSEHNTRKQMKEGKYIYITIMSNSMNKNMEKESMGA